MPEPKPYLMTCHWGGVENRRVTVQDFSTREAARIAWDRAIERARHERVRLRIELHTPWGVSKHTERADRDGFDKDLQPSVPWYILPASLVVIIFAIMLATGAFQHHQ